eukprot:jgi/Tetstr1/427415/TSEL_017579.t1
MNKVVIAGQIGDGVVNIYQFGIGSVSYLATAAAAAAPAAVAVAGTAAAGAAVVYGAPKAAHLYKSNSRATTASGTVRMWLKPRDETVVFQLGSGGVRYAVLAGAVLEGDVDGGDDGAQVVNWTTLHTPDPGVSSPAGLRLQDAYQRLRLWGDCTRLKRVDAVWHGGYSFCVVQVGDSVRYLVHPGKVSEAVMKGWIGEAAVN